MPTIHATVTINTIDEEYNDIPFTGADLNDIMDQIKAQYPNVESVVIVISF